MNPDPENHDSPRGPEPSRDPAPPPDDRLSPQGALPPTRQASRTGCLGRGGCGLSCLGLTVLVVICMGSFLSWLLADARLPLPESLVGPQTVAFSFAHLSSDDPGVNALMNHAVQQLRTTYVEQSTLPMAVKKTIEKIAPHQVRAFLPMQVVVTYDVLPASPATDASPAARGEAAPAPSPEAGQKRDTVVPTAVVSFGHFKGLSEVMFRSVESVNEPGTRLETYRGAEILIIPPRHPDDITAVGHVASTFIFSSRIDGVKLAIERLGSQSGTFGGRSAMASMYTRLDGRQDLLGVVMGDHGQIHRFLEAMAAAQDPREGHVLFNPAFVKVASAAVRRIGWDIDILSQTEISAHVIIACNTAEDANRVRSFTEQLLAEARQAHLASTSEVKHHDLEVEVKVRAPLPAALSSSPGTPLATEP